MLELTCRRRVLRDLSTVISGYKRRWRHGYSRHDQAYKRWVHVLPDLVPGHTAIDHPWFKASMRAEKNEYTDRYIWTDSVWEGGGEAATLRGISDRDGSAVVNFFSHQPAPNYGYAQPFVEAYAVLGAVASAISDGSFVTETMKREADRLSFFRAFFKFFFTFLSIFLKNLYLCGIIFDIKVKIQVSYVQLFRTQ